MKIGLIGAGNMASALARGWGEPVVACDNGSGRAAALVGEIGGEAVAGPAEVAERAEIVVLCHKPPGLAAVAAQVGDRAAQVVSVLGGVGTEQLAGAYPSARVAAAMPNTPVEIRRGVTCIAFPDGVDTQFAARVRELFERLGEAFVLPETQMWLATALSGVAPAYVALVMEAWIDSAVRAGLPPHQAARVLAPAVEGSAALVRDRGGDTLAVRRAVTSPGGITARGLEALEREGLRNAFAQAMAAILGAR